MKLIGILTVITGILLLTQCNKKMSPTEIENKLSTEYTRIPISSLMIPISIGSIELNRVVNEIVKYSIGEGITLEGGYKCKAFMSNDLNLQAIGNELKLTLPIDLEISPTGNFSNIKAIGELELQISSKFDIFQNQFLSKSEITNYKWNKKPVLKVLGVPIPIEGIANQIVKKYKLELQKSIDDYIHSSVDLNKVKSKLYAYFIDPFYSTEDNIIHLYSSPSEIALGPFKIQNDSLIIPILFYLENVIAEQRPIELENNLAFSIRPYVEEGSSFSIQSRVPMNYLSLLIKEGIENQEYGSGISKIKINKIDLSGQGEQVIVNLKTSGAFNGILEMRFIPQYDPATKMISLSELTLKSIEGKRFEKTILALLKNIAESKIKKMLQTQLNDLLQENVRSITDMLNQHEIMPGMIINGQLLDFSINHFQIANERMFFNIKYALNAGLKIYSIDTKNILQKR
ncbi:MAG: DUF4403 family protein [Saprospiraceae bacterium]|uniref:DUF4403 family protein n=1 Tax=Candidatus Defluviibacterium haderslevense TaxID=2981993 RepID=A0A9D7XI57_9BACT|nr:DUF4403 family protein [Candidatus Defluviibacterium haderslevense]